MEVIQMLTVVVLILNLTFVFGNILTREDTIDSEYDFSENPLTWYDAAQYCSDKNMDLLHLESVEELEYVNTIISNYNSEGIFWTSGMDLIPNSTANGLGQFWTISGSSIGPTFWLPGEPNDSAGNYEPCIMLMKVEGYGHMLNDERCTTLCYALCKARITIPCPTSTTTTCPECLRSSSPIPITCQPNPCPPCPTQEACSS